MTKKKSFFAAIFFIFSLVFFSCSRTGRLISIAENTLFSVNYGNFEEQINLFSLNIPGNIRTSFFMREGFFFVSNGEAEKIISFNSYGDLLSVYFNEDVYSVKNPGLAANSTEGIWKPISYPFELTGLITADSRKYLYAVALVPKERHEKDEDEKLLYSQVVLRISSDGSLIDYLGQQGPGGTPFPDIKNVYVTENNEVVVVSSINEGLCAYWFSETGFLKFKIPLELSTIPHITPESVNSLAGQADLCVLVENAVPDPYKQTLFVKADYYFPHIDEESKTQSGIDFVKTCIYPLDIQTGIYGEPLNILPYEEAVTEDFSKITYRLPYDFMGVTKNNWLYFVITTEEGFTVMMVQSETQNVIKRSLAVNHEDTLYYSLSLSAEGIISALLCEKEKARVVWWRTDGLVDSVLR